MTENTNAPRDLTYLPAALGLNRLPGLCPLGFAHSAQFLGTINLYHMYKHLLRGFERIVGKSY